MRNRLAPCLTCAAWLVAGAALARPAPPPGPPPAPTIVGEVVVQGRALKAAKSFARTVEMFVHDQGRPGPIGRISRWANPVCPKTAGLTQGLDDFVTRRIRDIAARVGAPAGACGEANLLVLFTIEPDRLMADVRKHHEALLGYHYVGETKALAAFQPPMKSWYVTMTVIPGGYAAFDRAYAPLQPPTGGSRIAPPIKSEFVFAMVVVDSNLLEGQAIGAVADRIAMLALSRPAPRDGCSVLPSVMDLLDPRCPSGGSTEGLTAYDEAYLKGLYASSKGEPTAFERSLIARRIVEETGAPPPAPSLTRAPPAPPAAPGGT